MVVESCDGKLYLDFTKDNDDDSNTDWNCCTGEKKCGLGEGDCDTDDECQIGLVCGSNNCKRDFDTSGSNWDSQADCCEGIYLSNINLRIPYIPTLTNY